MTLKRVTDCIFSFFFIILLLPLLLLLIFLVWINLGKPIFFVQNRVGLNGKVFKMIKFRTMIAQTDSKGIFLTDGERLNSFGRILRSTSLDELPELWNVIKGEMSLVGPRPLLEDYLQLYTPEQAKRHDVLPGITGWAQVNGRNDISWEEKFKLDVWYVQNQSFLLDIKILLFTLKYVLQKRGINKKGEATTSGFKLRQKKGEK